MPAWPPRPLPEPAAPPAFVDHPPAEDLLARGGYALGSFLLTGIAALCLLAVIRAAPSAVAEPPVLGGWLHLLAISFVAAVAGLTLAPLRPALKQEGMVGLFSLFMTLLVALTLKNSSYGLNGVLSDQGFYTTIVTKSANYMGNVDPIYQGLPTFYPSLIFYLLGRVAALADVEPYQMMRYGLFAVAYLLPFVTWWLWRRVVVAPLALAVVLSPLLFQDWYKFVEWISLTMFIPWWLHWVQRLGQPTPTGRLQRAGWWLMGAVLGSIIFQSYYYWFFIGAIALLLTEAARWRAPAEARDPSQLAHAARMLALTAFASAPFWAPYLVSMALTGGWEPLQNRWFNAGKAIIPLPFLNASLRGALLGLGLAHLIWVIPHDRVARGMLLLLLGMYGWVAVGYVGILFDTPLLTFRGFPLIESVLASAVLLAGAQFWQRWQLTARSREVARLLLALALIMLLFFSRKLAHDFARQSSVEQAHSEIYPTGLLAAYDTLVGREGLNITLLTSYRDLLVYRPVYSFLPWTAYFSHPAGLFHERANFLGKLAATSSPTLFAAAFQHNRYEPIDGVMLQREAGRWHLPFEDDNFPDSEKARRFTFSDEQLAPPLFEAHYAGPHTLFRPVQASDPLADLLTTQGLEGDALRYSLLTTFGPHLALTEPPSRLAEATRHLTTGDLSTLSVPVLTDLELAATGRLDERARAALHRILPHPLDETLVDQAGQPAVRLVGYELRLNRPAEEAILILYLESLHPTEEAYDIWIETTATATRHLDYAPHIPTPEWSVGDLYREQIQFPLAEGTHTIVVGLSRNERREVLFTEKGVTSIPIDLP